MSEFQDPSAWNIVTSYIPQPFLSVKKRYSYRANTAVMALGYSRKGIFAFACRQGICWSTLSNLPRIWQFAYRHEPLMLRPCCHFSPDGRLLVYNSGRPRRPLRVFNVMADNPFEVETKWPGRYWTGGFVASGKKYCSMTGYHLSVRSVKTGNSFFRRRVPFLASSGVTLDTHPSQDKCVMLCKDGDLVFWDIRLKEATLIDTSGRSVLQGDPLKVYWYNDPNYCGSVTSQGVYLHDVRAVSKTPIKLTEKLKFNGLNCSAAYNRYNNVLAYLQGTDSLSFGDTTATTVETFAKSAKYLQHKDLKLVARVTWNPVADVFLTGDVAGNVRWWNYKTCGPSLKSLPLIEKNE